MYEDIVRLWMKLVIMLPHVLTSLLNELSHEQMIFSCFLLFKNFMSIL